MPYRLRYSVAVDFVPQGMGLGQNASPLAPAAGQSAGSMTPAGPAQTYEINNSSFGSLPPVSNTFTSGDITALLASMSADCSTQLNAVIGRIQAFATGGG